jgi:hypothetical protein
MLEGGEGAAGAAAAAGSRVLCCPCAIPRLMCSPVCCSAAAGGALESTGGYDPYITGPSFQAVCLLLGWQPVLPGRAQRQVAAGPVCGAFCNADRCSEHKEHKEGFAGHIGAP